MRSRNHPLTPPEPGPEAAEDWVRRHLDDLCGDAARASAGFRGGQRAADAALEGFSVAGYARRRNEVLPASRRGASRLSPYIRHGLLPLPRVHAQVAGGPPRDVRKFRDELLWQEYARHLYARLGRRLGTALRRQPAQWDDAAPEPWNPELACVALCRDELERDGWLPNQARMWLASHWTVREGAAWRDGEDRFFRHLLDGSRAANRLGWQWTTGTAGGRPYGFSRWQVEKRAPGLCDRCALRDACPIGDWPASRPARQVAAPPALARDPNPDATGGPADVERRAAPEAVWITAESLGDADPALAANPSLPVVFVFDEPLLARLALSRKRLVFLVETLAELAGRRELALHRGTPSALLRDRPLATTFAPVPGWKRLREHLALVEVHPWPWLVRPHAGPVRSFSAWRSASDAA